MLLVILSILMLFVAWNHHSIFDSIPEVLIDGLDPMSWYLAKSTLWTFPTRFPKNDSTMFATARKIMDVGTYAIEKYVTFLDPSLNAIPFQQVPIHLTDGKKLDLRIYNFQQNASQKKKVLLWFHGGGWIMGSMEGNHAACLQFAQATDYIIVNGNYRLAPEAIFPTAANDAYDILQWIIEHIGEYGGDNENIIVSGESAGGNLAAGITSRYLKEREEAKKNLDECGMEKGREVCMKGELSVESRIKGAILVYPVLNSTITSPEALQHSRVNGFLTYDEMEWMKRLYQGSDDVNEKIRSSYLFSPLNTPEEILVHYPPTVMILAKYDVLTVEGKEFKKKLDNVGVRNQLEEYNTTIHAFFTGHPILGPRALKRSVELLKEIMMI
jgi:acetyl esterase